MDVTINISTITKKTISIKLPYYYQTSISTDGGYAYDKDTYGRISEDTMITVTHIDAYMVHEETYELSKKVFTPDNQADEQYFHPKYEISRSQFDAAYEKMQAFTSVVESLT